MPGSGTVMPHLLPVNAVKDEVGGYGAAACFRQADDGVPLRLVLPAPIAGRE